jgi:hypothetical protein
METNKAQRVIPDFASEAEEAKWWFDHQDELLEDFKQAAAEGRLGHGTGARSGHLPPISPFQLDPEDVSMAREQAAKRGLEYQAYLKQLLHEALLNANG